MVARSLSQIPYKIIYSLFFFFQHPLFWMKHLIKVPSQSPLCCLPVLIINTFLLAFFLYLIKQHCSYSIDSHNRRKHNCAYVNWLCSHRHTHAPTYIYSSKYKNTSFFSLHLLKGMCGFQILLLFSKPESRILSKIHSL